MVPNNDKNINAETSIIQALNELGLSAALKAAHINKRCGIEVKKVFMALFSLCFYGLSWNNSLTLTDMLILLRMPDTDSLIMNTLTGGHSLDA